MGLSPSKESLAAKDQAVRAYIQRLTMLDDLFMGIAFEDKACVECVLRVVLGLPDLMVEEALIKHNLVNLSGKSIEVDVLATDSHGHRYNIEVQRDPRGTIPRRARYHGCLLDTEALNRGDTFADLPESYVVFLTETDVLGGNLPIYHIERQIVEMERSFSDGLHIVYVNCACADDGSPIGDLAHDLRCADPSKMRYNVLRERNHLLKGEGRDATMMNETVHRLIEEFKDDWIQEGLEEGRTRGLEEGLAEGRATGLAKGLAEGRAEGLAEGRAEGLAEGRAEGRAEGKVAGATEASEAIAQRMLVNGGFLASTVAQLTGLSLERVQELARAQA